MDELRAVVVGAGILGKRHARVLHELEGVTLAAVASRTEARAQAVAQSYGAAAYDDVDRMLAEVECDVVVVATPDHLHVHPVLAALERRRHVLVEKPLATQVVDALRMVEAAAAHERVLQVNYSQRFVPEYAWIRERIAAGTIGRPVMVHSSKQDTIFVPTKMIDWAAHTSPMLFMSSHELDLVCWFLDARGVSVQAVEQRGVLERRGIAAHDGVDALVAFDTGATGSFHSSWIHPETWPQLVTERLTIIGDEGAIHYENTGRRLECCARSGGQVITFTGPQTATEVEGRLAGAFRTSLETFLDAVRTGTQPPTSAASTLHVTALQLAILEAATTGGTVMPADPAPGNPQAQMPSAAAARSMSSGRR